MNAISIYSSSYLTGRVATVKRLPVLHFSRVYIFWSFEIIKPIPGILEIYISVSDVA